MRKLPSIPDHISRRLLLAALSVAIATAVISQVMLQLGDGPRDERLDLSDQIAWPDVEVVLEDGLPPFLSSGGVYQPERTVFNFGFAVTGVLMIPLGVAIAGRTQRDLEQIGGSRMGERANLAGLLAASITGVSLGIMTRFPMHTHLQPHLVFAMLVFCGSLLWAACSSRARGELDVERAFLDHPVVPLRRNLLRMAAASFILMLVAVVAMSLTIAALLEWLLLGSVLSVLLTHLTMFAEEAADSE